MTDKNVHHVTLESWEIAYDSNLMAMRILVNAEYLIVLTNDNADAFLSAIEPDKGYISASATGVRLAPQEYTDYPSYDKEGNDDSYSLLNYRIDDNSDISPWVIEKDIIISLLIEPDDVVMFEHSLYSSGTLDWIAY